MPNTGSPKPASEAVKNAVNQYALEISSVVLLKHPFRKNHPNPSAEQLLEFSKSKEAQKLMQRFSEDLRALWAQQVHQAAGAASQKTDVTDPLTGNKKSWLVDFTPPQGSAGALIHPSGKELGDSPTQMPAPHEIKSVDQELASRAKPMPTDNGTLSGPCPNQHKPLEYEKSDALKPGQVPMQQGQKDSPVISPKITIHLPNAKDGVPYRVAATATLASGERLKIAAVRFPEKLGLTFDELSQEISGIPQGAGEHGLKFQVEPRKGERVTVEAQLVVNPDPKSLWQINEPSADLLFRKPHCSGEHVRGVGLNIVAGSRRGRSHEHAGSFRDDDYAIWHDTRAGWSFVVVADGAGSAPLSREGSRVVCSTFHRQISSELASERGKSLADLVDRWEAERDQVTKEIGLSFVELFRGCAVAAIEAIESVAAEQAAVPKEFSTTLLAAAVLRDSKHTFVSTLWVGDGAIAVYGPRGKVRLMGSPDGGEFAGQTRFLDRSTISSSSFSGRVNIGRYEDVTSVILMTDGVSDPKFETDQGLMEGTRWDAVWGEIEPLLAGENPSEAIVEWLNFFSPGNHDDRTLAVLW
jgi:hypothetical protein